MSDVKWKVGDKLVHAYGMPRVWKGLAEKQTQEYCESTGWRLDERNARPAASVCKEWCFVRTVGIGAVRFVATGIAGVRACSRECFNAGRPLNPAVRPVRFGENPMTDEIRRTVAPPTGEEKRRHGFGATAWLSAQLGRATGIDRERTEPSRTEVEWRKLPARYKQSIDPDEC